LSTRMEIKMTLSIPSTISRASNVRKAIQIQGSRNQSMTQSPPIAAPNNLVTSYTL
jgi:hypothetical protein